MNENITPLTDEELAEIANALQLTPAFIEASSRMSRLTLGAAYSPTVVAALRLLTHSRALTARVKELEEALFGLYAVAGLPMAETKQAELTAALNTALKTLHNKAALNKEPTPELPKSGIERFHEGNL